LAHHDWLRGLDQYASKIFEVIACPQPDCLADVEQYNIDILTVFGALKAWEDVLGEYMDKEGSFCLGSISPSPSHKETFRQRKRKAEEDWDNVQSKVHRVRAWEDACYLLQEDDVPMAQ
jgi:hypothetical protein